LQLLQLETVLASDLLEQAVDLTARQLVQGGEHQLDASGDHLDGDDRGLLLLRHSLPSWLMKKKAAYLRWWL
jgi:hypothetical protein